MFKAPNAYLKDGCWMQKCSKCELEQSVQEFPLRKIDVKRILDGYDRRNIDQLANPTLGTICNRCVENARSV